MHCYYQCFLLAVHVLDFLLVKNDDMIMNHIFMFSCHKHLLQQFVPPFLFLRRFISFANPPFYAGHVTGAFLLTPIWDK